MNVFKIISHSIYIYYFYLFLYHIDLEENDTHFTILDTLEKKEEEAKQDNYYNEKETTIEWYNHNKQSILFHYLKEIKKENNCNNEKENIIYEL